MEEKTISTDKAAEPEVVVKTTVSTPVATAKKSKSMLWILLGVLALCVGCCACSTIYMTTNPDIQDSFKDGFCQSYTQNGSPEGSDPFGWCE